MDKNFSHFKFLIKLASIIFISFLSNSLCSQASPPGSPDINIKFADWRLSQAQEQKETLQKESASLSETEIKNSQQRAVLAFQKKAWSEAISEYSRIVGKQPENREAWLHLALALQNRNREEENWKTLDAAKLAGVNLYLISKTPEEKAEALLIFGSNFKPFEEYESPTYLEIYEAAQALTDIAKLKASHAYLADRMAFHFYNIEVNNQNSPPSACFNFSHPIASQNIDPADFFVIAPKVDGALKMRGRSLCLSPLKFGATYDVTLKAGLANIYGEKLSKDEKLSFKIKDQPSLLSFKTKAYVLRKTEKALIPLSGVNVDAVDIKILRINDRSLTQAVGENGDFLTRLWDYSVEQIEKNKGELLYQGTMNFDLTKNQTITKLIPFSEVVSKTENGVYVVQASEKGVVIGERAQATQWVIVSDLGLSTFTQSDGGIWVNARSLQTAKALNNVELRLLSANNTVLTSLTTDRDGMGFFDPSVTKGKGGNRPLLVLAFGPKDDFSFLTLDQPSFDLSDRGVAGRKISGGFDAFLYTEQGVYRPGSTVHVNALLRDEKGNAKGKLPLTFKVLRSDEVLVSEQTLTGSDLGFYEFSLPLQSSSRTGRWTVLAFLDPKKEAMGRVEFSVEDFVPSRITIKLATEDKLLKLKDPVPVHVTAKYLFGAPAGGLMGDGTLTLRARPNPFPAWPGYRFGLITDPFKDSKTPLFLEPLDKEGKGVVSVQLDKLPDTSLPLEGVIRLSLSDQGGRPEIGTLTLPVETTAVKIGIKPNFGSSNDQNSYVLVDTENTAIFDVIAIDESQKAVSIENLDYELYEETPQYTWYQSDRYSPWQYQIRIDDKFLTRGTLSTKGERGDHHEKLKVSVPNWGQYRLEIRDPKTHVASSIRFYKGFETTAGSEITPDKITVRVSKEPIPPNGTVELQIESPFDGSALVTIANQKLLETRNINISKKGTRLKLSANEDWGVGVYCLVSAFRPWTESPQAGANQANGAKTDSQSFLPKRAIGVAWIGIDPKDRLLNVNFDLPQTVKPRQTIEIPVTVSQQGESVSGKTQIAIAAVDEGILKLTEFATPKPEDYFFGKRRLAIELRDLYGKLIDPLPGTVGSLKVGGDVGLLSRNLQALSKRSFKIVSLYQGLVELDKEGKGKLKLQLPDFNGSLRLMAVAFNETSLGSKEASLLVRDPVVVEGTLPRFLAPHDKSQMTLSLHNVQGPEGQYQLHIKTTGPIIAEQDRTKTVETIELKQQETKDLEIPIQAQALGDATITVKLSGHGMEVERNFDISIRPLQPYQLHSETQLVKPGEEVKINEGVLKNFEASTVVSELSWSTAVPWDTQAIFKRLAEYPYGCVEQSTSRAIGALYQSDKSDQSNKNEKSSSLKSKSFILDQIIAGVSEKQMASGAFSLWNLTEDSGDTFLTAYVMDFLLRAKAQGIQIPKYTLERGLTWLSKGLDRREYDGYALTEISYALYVLTKADLIETGALRYFFDTYGKEMKNPIARAFLGTALALRGDFQRSQEAFQDIMAYTDKFYDSPYGSYLRDKLILLTLSRETLEVAPSLVKLTEIVNTLIPDIQRGIQSQTKMVNLSTQELAWAVLAAASMEQTQPGQEKASIEMVVNNEKVSSPDSHTHIPVTADELQKEFSVKNNGKTTLWQNLSISGIPKDLPKAESSGIEIQRHYYTLNGEKLSMDEIKQGMQMVVVVEGKVLDELPHQLLLVDFLPAGLEIENSRLGQNGLTESYTWLEPMTKAEYTELRDDRFVASMLLEGKIPDFRLAYVMRAVTPGTYHRPGLYIEDMYAPTYFARTATETVKIKAR